MRFLLLAADEGAQHAVEHADVMSTNWLPAVTALVVFGLSFGFLYWKVWPKIVQGLEDREQKIRLEIQSAQEAREQAKAALAEYERSLANARDEANQMIVKARSDANAVAQELRTRNEAEVDQLKQRAAREIESAKRSAISALHAEAAGLAADIASKILKREISADDQQQLIEESLRELASSRGN